MLIGALVHETSARARLQDALRGHAAIRHCEEQEELTALVSTGLVGVVVVGLRDRRGEPTLRTVRALREGFPSVPVLAYCALTPETSRAILGLARVGVNDLILRHLDDEGVALRSAIATAQDHCGAKRVLEMLAPHVPSTVMPFLAYCLEHARRSLSVLDVAAALGVHRKTLVDRLASPGLPTPSAVIAWCRLILAARMLEDPGRSVEQVALQLDFPSGAALRNMFKRYTGLKASEIRENGGMRCVVHVFKQTLAPVAKSVAS